MTTEADRLRAALAICGPAHAALAARIKARTLPAAITQLAAELVGPDAWAWVTGDARPSARRRAARR